LDFSIPEIKRLRNPFISVPIRLNILNGLSG